MKFGRLTPDGLSKVDFCLPKDSPDTQALLAQWTTKVPLPAIYIGCSVWTDRSFVGKIYPPKTPPKNFLKLYCQQFNSVELNATFYGIPSVAQIQQWKAAAVPGFKFCPKITQHISHRKAIETQQAQLIRFIEAVSHFEEALGVTFLQLPPYFQPRDLIHLARFIAGVPAGFPLAVELRHPAWFTDKAAQSRLWECLRDNGVIAVITDVAGRRDVLHQTLTTKRAFIRFVGNNLHTTDYTRIDDWVDRLQHWLAQGLEEVYFLLHEPEKALCADLAQYMIQQLNARMQQQLTPPHLLYSQVQSLT